MKRLNINFASRDHGPAVAELGRWMKTIPLCGLLICLWFSAVAAEPPTYFVSRSLYDRTNHTHHLIDCGYRERKMAFIIFQSWAGDPPKVSPYIGLKLRDDDTRAGITFMLEGSITMPDGVKKELVSSQMAFEYTNGVFRASVPIDITDDQFSRYLEASYAGSMSTMFTADGLKKFIEEEKAKSSNQNGAANGSQPIRSVTNRTSSAAGSRR